MLSAKCKMKVIDILLTHEKARDDDRFLISEYWKFEMQNNTEGLIQSLCEGKITHPESIRRTRQKLQEKYEHLRGSKWNIRHKMAAAVSNQLTFFDKLGV